MHEIPIKFAMTTAFAAASGAASVISEHTLIPLSIFTAFSTALVIAAWKVATAVTKATDRLERVEKQIDDIERKFNDIPCNGGKCDKQNN